MLHYKLLQDFSELKDPISQSCSSKNAINATSATAEITADSTGIDSKSKNHPCHTNTPLFSKSIYTVPSDLDNRTRKLLEQYVSFTQFTELLKTRDRTYTAVSRYLLSHLLDIDSRQQQALQDLDYAPYLRVLGMRRDASPLLKALRQHSDIPILTRLATEEKDLNLSQQLLLRTDIQAAHIYNSVLTARTGQSIKNEYRHPLIYC